MPLSKGESDKALAHNIHKLLGEGYPLKQALAIALERQRVAKKGKDD